VKTAPKSKAVSPAEQEGTLFSKQSEMGKLRGKVDWQGDLDAWRRDSDLLPLIFSKADFDWRARRASALRTPADTKVKKNSS
jgi:hypothetical protein